MIIRLTNTIDFNIKDVPKSLLKELKDDLSIENPYFENDNSVPQFIRLYKIDDGVFSIPRGCMNYLKPYLNEYEIDYELSDERLLLESLNDIDFKFKLRGYQKKAVKKAFSVTQSTIEAPCFSGDTLVKTLDGQKEIREVKIGDYVYCWDIPRKNIHLRKVLNTKVIKPKERMVRVTIQDKDGEWTITCTENHKFYTETSVGYDWIKAKDLKGHRVLINDNPEFDYRCYDFLNAHQDKTNSELSKLCNTTTDYIGTYRFRAKKDFEVESERVLCECGCGFYARFGNVMCRGHHQESRLNNMGEKEKKKYLKNFIRAGKENCHLGGKNSAKSLELANIDEKSRRLKGFALGNKESLKSLEKASGIQIELYERLCSEFPNIDWKINKVINTRNGKYFQVDIISEKEKIVIEYDGPTHYSKIYGAERLAKQKKSDRLHNFILTKNGYTVIRFVDKSKVYSDKFDVGVSKVFKGIKSLIKYKKRGDVIEIRNLYGR